MVQIGRLTPASAGRTSGAARPRRRSAAHPRVGGADAGAPSGEGADDGSPPRRRGGPWWGRGSRPRWRLTPASAGRTSGRPSPRRRASAHPRVGGADHQTNAGNWTATGSPPRRRGGRTGPSPASCGRRLTPASAGRTTDRSSSRTCRAAHPRVGGADGLRATTLRPGGGSPPRRRGGRHHRAHVHQRIRLTPASAGRTSVRTATPRSGRAHPRVGGADCVVQGTTVVTSGSPPRRRGGRSPRPRRGRRRRLTPASAGRTVGPVCQVTSSTAHPRVGGADLTMPFTDPTVTGSPPRRRGGLKGPSFLGRCGRLTPASAGRTPRRSSRLRRSAAHPRVGGADCGTFAFACRVDGSPPRRRGGHAPHRRRAVLGRLTPASAGRTIPAQRRGRPATAHPRVGGADPED